MIAQLGVGHVSSSFPIFFNLRSPKEHLRHGGKRHREYRQFRSAIGTPLHLTNVRAYTSESKYDMPFSFPWRSYHFLPQL